MVICVVLSIDLHAAPQILADKKVLYLHAHQHQEELAVVEFPNTPSNEVTVVVEPGHTLSTDFAVFAPVVLHDVALLTESLPRRQL